MADEWKADYKAMLGEKLLDQFMATMDHEVSGVFYPQLLTITWKRGHLITKVRAEKMCAKIKEAINERGVAKCHSVELLRVYNSRPMRGRWRAPAT